MCIWLFHRRRCRLRFASFSSSTTNNIIQTQTTHSRAVVVVVVTTLSQRFCVVVCDYIWIFCSVLWQQRCCCCCLYHCVYAWMTMLRSSGPCVCAYLHSARCPCEFLTLLQHVFQSLGVLIFVYRRFYRTACTCVCATILPFPHIASFISNNCYDIYDRLYQLLDDFSIFLFLPFVCLFAGTREQCFPPPRWYRPWQLLLNRFRAHELSAEVKWIELCRRCLSPISAYSRKNGFSFLARKKSFPKSNDLHWQFRCSILNDVSFIEFSVTLWQMLPSQFYECTSANFTSVTKTCYRWTYDRSVKLSVKAPGF